MNWNLRNFPSFEEGTLRPINKCLATLIRAQRGRSDTLLHERLTDLEAVRCRACGTRPAAPTLRPPLLEEVKNTWLQFIHTFFESPPTLTTGFCSYITTRSF